MASEQIEDALDAFVRSKQKGTDSGNYQRNARRVIEEWIGWLADREEPVETFDQLKVSHMRQYARQLKERVDEGDLAGSTGNTYWNYIAAFLGWCVYEELVAENPARTRRAEEELPDKRPRSDRQQFWSRADREALLTHLNERAHTAVDERGLDAVKELRDRALAALLAYSGVRGGEILRDPNDERRSGLCWRDVDLDLLTAMKPVSLREPLLTGWEKVGGEGELVDGYVTFGERSQGETATYFAEAPDDPEATGEYTLGPVEYSPDGGETWVTLPETTETNTVVGASTDV